MKRFLTALALFFSVVAVASTGPNKKDKPLENTPIDGYKGIWFTIGQAKSEYGDKYSGGLGTYTMKHIPMAIYAKEVNKTFFVFGGTTGPDAKYLLCMVGCYDHKSGKLRKPVVVYDKGKIGVSDPHDDPTISIDKDGYIWVFVAGRGNVRPGIRYKSSKPYDISHFDYVNESIMAYPQVHYDPQKGFALFYTRYDGVRRLFFKTSPDGVNWSDSTAIASIMGPGEKKSGHYQFSTYRDGKLMTAFNRHKNGDCDTRTNIYFVQSSDWGKTWTTIDGKALSMPLREVHNPALVHDYESEGKNCYIKDIVVDKNGNPVILYLISDNYYTGPQGGDRDWYTVRWTGEKWEYSFITRSTHCYDSGSLYIDGDTWTIVAPTAPGPQYWGTGGEMCIWKTSDQGKTWKMTRQITSNSELNHTYARRPENCQNGFYAFWADGDTDKMSISHLYFCDSEGNVWRMPYNMKKLWEKPELLIPKQ